MKAKYKCCNCHHKYEGEPGPTMCPKCGHLYVKWVNYEQWRLSDKSIQPTKLTEAIQNMIAVEEAAHHCPDCAVGSFCPTHDIAFWEFWGVVKESLPSGG